MLPFFQTQFTEMGGIKMTYFPLKEYAKPLPHDPRCVIFPHAGWSIPGEGLMNIRAPLQ